MKTPGGGVQSPKGVGKTDSMHLIDPFYRECQKTKAEPRRALFGWEKGGRKGGGGLSWRKASGKKRQGRFKPMVGNKRGGSSAIRENRSHGRERRSGEKKSFESEITEIKFDTYWGPYG